MTPKTESDTLPVADLGAYPAERLIEEIELLSDIRTSIDQVAEGRAVDNDEAKALLRGRFGA